MAEVVICPHWHYGLIILAGQDIRGHNALLEVIEDARGMRYDDDRLFESSAVWSPGGLARLPQ